MTEYESRKDQLVSLAKDALAKKPWCEVAMIYKDIEVTYFGDIRFEELQEVYIEDGDVMVYTTYTDENGETEDIYSTLREFSNSEIENILSVAGLL